MAAVSDPFSLHVAEAALADLCMRLARTCLPNHEPESTWTYGTDVG